MRTWIGAAVLATAGVAGMAGVAAPAAGQAFDMSLLRPSNTGIPGEQVLWATYDEGGRLWVSARWPFWGEGGVGVLDGSTWTTYSNVDTPMPSQWVNSVAFDGDVTWFGTDAGLVRFDGSTWTIHRASNSPLPADGIGSLRFDSQGRLWMIYRKINTTIQGAAMFDGVNWEVHPLESIGLDSFDIGGLAVDGDDTVWVGTRYVGGIAKYDGAQWTVLDGDNGYSDWPAVALTVDPNGDLWTHWDGIQVFDGSAWSDRPTPPGDISVIKPLADGTYYVGTYGGVVHRRAGSSWTSFVYGNHVYSIDLSPDGEVVVGGLAQVQFFTPQGVWLKAYNTWNTGVPDYFIDDFMRDSAGNMWIATGEAGASRFDGAIWRNWGAHNGDAEPWPFEGSEPIAGLYEDDQGNIWMGGNGVARWNGSEFTGFWNWANSNLGTDLVNAIAQDNDGDIWLATDGSGVFRFNGSDWEHHGFAGGYSPNRILSLARDAQGNLWAGSALHLYRYDGQTWTTVDDAPVPPPINEILLAPDGRLWFASGGGAAVYDGQSWFVHNASNSGIVGGAVYDVDVREDGAIAVVSHDGSTWPYFGGVAIFDGLEWHSFTPENSPLPHWQVNAVQFNAEGDVWVSCLSEAIAVIDMPEVTATPAELTDVEVAYGSLVSGDLSALLASDNAYYRTRSRLGFSALEPNLTEVVIGASTDVADPASLAFALETRINNPGGTAKVRLKNWTTNSFQQVATYPLSQQDTLEDIEGVDATDRVRAEGRIETSIKHAVMATFSAQGFDSYFDLVRVTVE